MGIFIDLTGKKIGRLTVIRRVEDYISPKGQHGRRWLCKCDCGKECIVTATHLNCKDTKSCGCLLQESKGNTKHNKYHTRLYKIFRKIKERCYNKNCRGYENYGARGIKMCKEWREDFLSFYSWAKENGYDENAKKFDCTIDRIDVNGDYCPENCRWVNMKTQGRNKRNNKFVSFNGETHCLSEWAEKYGIKYLTFYKRYVYKGWDFEKALTTPNGG